MLILPAIDLKGGRCVRLFQGRRGSETVYGDDPGAMARRWVEDGARFLHVVDLDGAFDGSVCNLPAIESILKAVKAPVQVGGGIRSHRQIEAMMDVGVDRVIVGTRAALNREWVQQALRIFGPDRIVVGIDAAMGRVMVKGWEEATDLDPVDLADTMRELGAVRAVYTDISRDGAMTGPNVAATARLARETGLAVIASGGISSLGDVERIAELGKDGVEGMIIGKALYEGAFTLPEAIGTVSKATGE